MNWIDSFTHNVLFGYVLWTPVAAILTAALAIRLLHAAKLHARMKKYLPQQVVDYSTVAIIVFTVCVWVIDVVAKFVFTKLH